MNDISHIVVVDDQKEICDVVQEYLTGEGYRVSTANDGAGMRRAMAQGRVDLVILDLMLPGMDGLMVCQALRAQRETAGIPIIMLTARGEEGERVRGLATGADDYIVKPFSVPELLARIRALLRRSVGHAKSEFLCGPVRLDSRTGRVTVDGTPVKLTSHEYRLLAYLMHHTGRVVSRTELVEHLYDQDFDRDSNTIEVFVGRIRRKLGVDVIQTVRGLGYLLTPPSDAR
jgi:two-component system OmpR family response regulator